MHKIICIYPNDPSTFFLRPLYDHLSNIGCECTHSECLIDELREIDGFIFLGHGNSSAIYSSRIHEGCEFCEYLLEQDLKQLERPCLLLSCRSNELVSNFNTVAIGFGHMPTSIEDIKERLEYDFSFPVLEQGDIDIYNMGIINSIIRSIESIDDFFDFEKLYNSICMNANIEIVDCLLKKTSTNYRFVAELLQEFKNDCLYHHV